MRSGLGQKGVYLDMIQRLVLSLLLGALALFVFILGAEPFNAPGQNSVGELVSAGLAVVVYCALAQFWLASRDRPGLRAKWPTLAAMIVPLFGWLPIMDHGFSATGATLVFSGGLGAFAGAALAGRTSSLAALTEAMARDRRARDRRWLQAGVALTGGVGLVIAAAVIPMARAVVSQAVPPRPPVTVPFAVCAGLHLIVAFLLAVPARRLPDRLPSTGQLIVAALFIYILGTALAGAASSFWLHGGFEMQPLPLLLAAGVATNLVALALVTATAFAADAERPAPAKHCKGLPVCLRLPGQMG